jgi:DNA-binding beta-propeller fold protein YncE
MKRIVGGIFLAAASLASGSELFTVSNDQNFVGLFRLDGTNLGAIVQPGAGGLQNGGGIAYGPDGSLYLNETSSNSILKYDGNTGAFQSVFVSTTGNGGLDNTVGELPAGILVPGAMTFGPDGNLYVASANTGQILRYNGMTGAFMSVFVAAGSGGLANPQQILFGPDGNLYVSSQVADALNAPGDGQVMRYNGTTGAFMNLFVDSPNDLVGIAFGPDGNLYANESFGAANVGGVQLDGGQVERFSGITGGSLGTFGSNYLFEPQGGIAVGPDENLYVTSFFSPLSADGTGTITKFDPLTGTFLGNFDTVGSNPYYIAFHDFPDSVTTPEPASVTLTMIGILLCLYSARTRKSSSLQ